MKASDLMLGDLVRWFGNLCKVDLPFLITEFSDKDESNNVEPIPLTDEILEKNGFIEDDNDDCWGDADCYFSPHYIDKKINSWEATIEPTSGRGDFNGNLTYIHELQHALRLCGIEKKIIL